jgi:hypothetical protein
MGWGVENRNWKREKRKEKREKEKGKRKKKEFNAEGAENAEFAEKQQTRAHTQNRRVGHSGTM